jgi:hypothetical protein
MPGWRTHAPQNCLRREDRDCTTLEVIPREEVGDRVERPLAGLQKSVVAANVIRIGAGIKSA